MVKESIHQEDISTTYMNPTNGAPTYILKQYIKQTIYIKETITDIKGETGNTNIIGDFNISLATMIRSRTQNTKPIRNQCINI